MVLGQQQEVGTVQEEEVVSAAMPILEDSPCHHTVLVVLGHHLGKQAA